MDPRVKELSKLQKKLLKSGYISLKNGGEIVYSTCTLNKEENENVLEWAISELSLKLLNIDLQINGSINAISENPEIKKAIRILPSKDNEGFFIARLKKCE